MATKKLPAPPMHRDEWVAAFASAVLRFWPEASTRHANTVGLSRSTGALGTDPAEAARKWVTEAKTGR
jgi:O-acetyl-ADP-ribose deacetylase (regulator of RNase III)